VPGNRPHYYFKAIGIDRPGTISPSAHLNHVSESILLPIRPMALEQSCTQSKRITLMNIPVLRNANGEAPGNGKRTSYRI
jgi:hypothetical protein